MHHLPQMFIPLRQYLPQSQGKVCHSSYVFTCFNSLPHNFQVIHNRGLLIVEMQTDCCERAFNLERTCMWDSNTSFSYEQAQHVLGLCLIPRLYSNTQIKVTLSLTTRSRLWSPFMSILTTMYNVAMSNVYAWAPCWFHPPLDHTKRVPL